VEFLPAEANAVPRGRRLQHAHALGHHLAADAVPGNHCYGMFFHGSAVYRIGRMRFAAIETSTSWCSVAVWADGEIAARETVAGSRHSELVLPMLQSLLKNFDDLQAVAFGAGPGSFTGLRIACALAQG